MASTSPGQVVEFPLEVASLSVETGEGHLVCRTVHQSGLRILTERVPGASSATVGFWVPVGSRDEREGQFGSTHFLEHLLFKGTAARSALDIAVAFDEVGGESNAVTSKEYTCYYAKVRGRDVPVAAEVLTDMLLDSRIDPGEFESERQVILEELAMAEDDPGDVVSELFASLVFGDHPLGRPIGGTNDSIRAADRDGVWRHYRANYEPRDLVVTAAGAVEHEAFVDLVLTQMRRYGWGASLGLEASPRARRGVATAPGRVSAAVSVRAKDLEQVSLMMGVRGISSSDERRWPLSLVTTAFGSGMSSRLFQEIRERRGLAYSVFASAGSYSDAGVFAMYAATMPKNAPRVAGLLREELARLVAGGITETELRRARGQVGGAITLAFEDTYEMMSRLGKSEIGTGRFRDLSSTLRRFDEVTLEDARGAVELLGRDALTVAAVGQVSAASLG